MLRYSGLNKGEYLSNFFHSIALGTALVPLVYMTIRRLSHPELIYLIGILVFFWWLILSFKNFKRGKVNVYTTYQDIFSITVLIVVVLGLLHLSHFTDVIFLENGFKIRNVHYTETIFHLGIINVLKDTFPPFFPYASGHNFSYYHLNMHLEIEMFKRLLSVDTVKLTFFYFPLLYFSLLAFVPYMYIRKYWGLSSIGVLVGILMFGSDFSFSPGLLGIVPQGEPWISFFSSTTIWSLFTLNGYLPALFIMFLCVFYLKIFYEQGRLLHLLVFAFLGYSAYGFKISMGPHIMGVAFLTGIASIIIMKDKKKGMLLCTVSVLTSLLIALDVILFRGSTGNNIISFDLFSNFHLSLKKLGIPHMSWFFYPVTFPIYIAAFFGIRLLGFYLLKDIFMKKTFDPAVIFLAVFVISGFLISEVIYLGSPSYDKNNAAFFSAESLMAAWLLFSYFLLWLRAYGKKYLVFVIAVIFLSAPSTIQFLNLRFDNTYYPVNHNAIEIVKYLQTTPPRSVILHPPNYLWPSLASNFAGRQSVINFFRSFPSNNIGEEETIYRFYDVESFFMGDNANRSFVLKQYKVDYVYAPWLYAIILDREPLLKQVLKNNEYVLYRVNKQSL